MNKQKTVDSKVLAILRECPETRYDDMQLTLLIHSMRLRQEQMEQRKNQLLFVLTLQLPLLKEMEKKRTQTEKRALEILSILHLDHLF